MAGVVVERKFNLMEAATAAIGDAYRPNKFGHDRHAMRFIMRSSPYKDGDEQDAFGHKRKSHALYAICDKIRNFATNPLAFPEIGYKKTQFFVQKHGDYKQQLNSQLREKIANTAIYFANHVSFISSVIGIRGYGKHGEFRCFDKEHATRVTGMSYDQMKVAIKFLDVNGMLERQRTWVEKEDGSYGGRPSVYYLTPKFWQAFRCVDLFEDLRAFSYKKALADLGNSVNKLAASLSTRIPDEVMAAIGKIKLKKPKKLKAEDWADDTIQHYLAQLPKNKHHVFQVRFAEIYTESLENGSELSVKQALKSAFKSV